VRESLHTFVYKATLWCFPEWNRSSNFTSDGRSEWKVHCLCLWIPYLGKTELCGNWERISELFLAVKIFHQCYI